MVFPAQYESCQRSTQPREQKEGEKGHESAGDQHYGEALGCFEEFERLLRFRARAAIGSLLQGIKKSLAKRSGGMKSNHGDGHADHRDAETERSAHRADLRSHARSKIEIRILAAVERDGNCARNQNTQSHRSQRNYGKNSRDSHC
jgi:hypothetical protein